MFLLFFFFSSRRRHTRSVSAFLLNRSSDLENLPRFAWSTPQRQKLKFLPLRRYNLTLNLLSRSRSEERFSRNAETDLVCRLLLEKKKTNAHARDHTPLSCARNSHACAVLSPF